MTKLSVNINKIATLRNARGGALPDLIQVAKDIERFGADGITVHPRPDERHITYQDARDLKKIVSTEFNIEGYPSKDWLELVKELKPTQATLVPDEPGQLTSDHGWDTISHKDLLVHVISQLQDLGIRTSLFVDPIEQFIEGAANVGVDRIEFYTGPYAHMFDNSKEKAIERYEMTAQYAKNLGLGINAGHDLNLNNLAFLIQRIPFIDEVSIGHALICDALYLGLEETIKQYLEKINLEL